LTSNPALDAVQRPAPESASGTSESESQQMTLGPILLFVTVWLGGSWLIVGSLLHQLLPGGWVTVLAVLAWFAIPVSVVARGLTNSLYPSALTRLFVLRPAWYAMLFSPLLAVTGIVGAMAGLPFGASGAFGRVVVLTAATLFAVFSVIGYFGSRKLVVRQLELTLPRLPAGFDGFKLVQLSDLHVGPHTSRKFLRRIADAVRDAMPDMIVYTGDQVDDFPRDVDHLVSALGDIEAPLGTFAIPGNHDVYAGWDAVRSRLSAAGITVLVNESITIERDAHRLWIAGTGDPAGSGWQRDGGLNAAPDVDRTLQHIPAGEPTIVLAHNPVLWPALAKRGVDLTLSGHTHYGQFAIPRWNWNIAGMFLEHSMGIRRKGDSTLYINPGTNYWGIPLRIGTPPEVTVLTLRRSAEVMQ